MLAWLIEGQAGGLAASPLDAESHDPLYRLDLLHQQQKQLTVGLMPLLCALAYALQPPVRALLLQTLVLHGCLWRLHRQRPRLWAILGDQGGPCYRCLEWNQKETQTHRATR